MLRLQRAPHRGVAPGRSLNPLPSAEELLAGDLHVLGLMPGASNYTFLCRLGDAAEDEADDRLAVYKPRRGEAPLWDFPSGTLCHREVAACLVSDAAGFGVVPPTVLRAGPAGIGSVQAFVHHDFECTAFDLYRTHEAELRRIALFDLVINNADRKAGHVFPDAEGHVWAIDHGICFHAEPKLRTVLWDYADSPITEEERAYLGRLAEALTGELGERLMPLLDGDERVALRMRLRAALRAKVFPQPGPGRSFPWPPV